MRKVIYRYYWVSEIHGYLPVSKDFIDSLVDRLNQMNLLSDSSYHLKVNDRIPNRLYYNIEEK